MISFNEISYRYSDQEVLIDLSLSLQSNRINCFLGPSGCGKTTILNLLAGIIQPDNGTIRGLESMDISYIFQETRILPWKTVYQNVIFPMKGKFSKLETSSNAKRFLKHVKLWDKKDVYPSHLSGGMKQRVSIARAFAYPSSVILMDEAFQSLDILLKNHLLQDFAKSWMDDPRTVICVTHDVDEALLLGQNIILLPSSPISEASNIEIDQNPGIFRENIKKYKEQILCELSSCR
ncbi:MAG: ABC transporter ATP-binding protein [Bacteroidota bacterium]|nr:ABC transporter ATP-binding protein [Bacteroidota bacterium]